LIEYSHCKSFESTVEDKEGLASLLKNLKLNNIFLFDESLSVGNQISFGLTNPFKGQTELIQ
jgi:hypothetical protein